MKNFGKKFAFSLFAAVTSIILLYIFRVDHDTVFYASVPEIAEIYVACLTEIFILLFISDYLSAKNT